MVLSNHLPDGSETGWKQMRFIGKPFGQSIIWHVATKLLQSVLLSWCCRMAPLTTMLLWVVLCTKKQLRCMEICYGQGNKSVSSLWEQKGSHKGRHCGRILLQTTHARWEGEQNLPQKTGISPLNVGPDSHGGWELEPLWQLLNGYHSREQTNNNIAGVYGGQVCASGPG